MPISTSTFSSSLNVSLSFTHASISLSGADRLAIKTGALVFANCEAINCLAKAGVPEHQLYRIAGGERVPLFTKIIRDQAISGTCEMAPAPPGAPPLPHPNLAVASAHIWPSLHCLMPSLPGGGHPEVIDTGEVYTGEAHPYVCTSDITRGMKYGLLKIGTHMPREKMDEGLKSFSDYVQDRESNVFSHADGGQIMVNFLVDGKSILWNAHLGSYEGIMKILDPKPDVTILGIAGRANCNGRPFDGSAAAFALQEVGWLGQPEKVIWCLHDERYVILFTRLKAIADNHLLVQSNLTGLIQGQQRNWWKRRPARRCWIWNMQRSMIWVFEMVKGLCFQTPPQIQFRTTSKIDIVLKFHCSTLFEHRSH